MATECIQSILAALACSLLGVFSSLTTVTDGTFTLAAGLLNEDWRNPGDILGDLAKKGLQERESEKLQRNKFKAAVEYKACTLRDCVKILMAGTFREENPSIRQPYKRCMEYYHISLAATLLGVETLLFYIRADCSMEEMEKLAEIVQIMMDITRSFPDSSEALMQALDRVTDEEDREEMADKWCVSVKNWPPIPELHELQRRRLAKAA
ncbi:hypothetical protein ARMSODRAFT_1083509 [Armillaria solidipes]|uniref:Fungal STAND N-terminal Goodbye domain-containing protein n=1 Tax=Armillaria solidipes TaxID=1076256 RepID=A0A2H3BK73_9AGAR|nr:hypothetical protein ARMSODRAFT_1083509 [Armillaria solidipes]